MVEMTRGILRRKQQFLDHPHASDAAARTYIEQVRRHLEPDLQRMRARKERDPDRVREPGLH